jgi:hypothetical protein
MGGALMLRDDSGLLLHRSFDENGVKELSFWVEPTTSDRRRLCAFPHVQPHQSATYRALQYITTTTLSNDNGDDRNLPRYHANLPVPNTSKTKKNWDCGPLHPHLPLLR